MYSTPSHFLEDSFSGTKPPAFDLEKSSIFEASVIQAKLNRRLGPEYVSQRPSPGGGPKLTYVEGWKIIGLANEVFGYNGWSSTVTRIETDFIDMDPESRRCNVGVTAVVKVTLKDGTYHEDIGYGSGDNLKSKGAALDKAKKEAVTDGVKRALRNFGNLLGLCLYEKSFAQEVIKIKPQLPKFDQSDLHRREKLDTTSPSASSSRDAMSPMVVSSKEDVKPPPLLQHQIRVAPSRPSPLRNPVMGAADARHDEQEKESPAQARPRNVQFGRLPQQTEREATLPLPEEFDVKPVTLRAHQPSDPDLDSYFNDEDNDAFLAVEDSAMQGTESCDILGTIGSGEQSVIHNASLNGDISRSGSPPAPASALTSDARVSTPQSDKSVSTLRQAIRASAASLATATTAGVKRPAEALRSLDRTTDERGTLVSSAHRSPYQSHSRDTRAGPMQQQQRLSTNNGRRAPLGDLPIEESTDVKRVRR